MAELPPPPNDPPKDASSLEPNPWLRGLNQVLTFVVRVLGTFGDRWVLMSAIAAYVAWIYSLPPDQRALYGPERLAALINEISGSALITLGGWGIAATLLAIGAPVFYMLIRRAQKQGAELAKLRKEDDQGRISSRDIVGLAAYGEQLRLDYPAGAPAAAKEVSKPGVRVVESEDEEEEAELPAGRSEKRSKGKKKGGTN